MRLSGKQKYTIWLVVIGYFTVAVLVYRFRNPSLTETELFLRIPDALLWRP